MSYLDHIEDIYQKAVVRGQLLLYTSSGYSMLNPPVSCKHESHSPEKVYPYDDYTDINLAVGGQTFLYAAGLNLLSLYALHPGEFLAYDVSECRPFGKMLPTLAAGDFLLTNRDTGYWRWQALEDSMIDMLKKMSGG